MKINQEDIIQLNHDGKDRVYEYDGDVFPSVTSIIGSVLDKPAITPWAYKTGVEGALTVLRNEVARSTKLSQAQDYLLNTTYEQLANEIKANGLDIESKKQDGGDRGLIVHQWVEAIANGETPPEVPAEQMPYVESLQKWLDDYEPEFIVAEQKVVHPGLGYAGTFDALVRIGNHPPRKRHTDLTGKTCLIDFKTNTQGAVYADQHLPQVEAYAEAYTNAMGGPQIDERVVVGIGPSKDGKAKYQTTVSYATIQIFTPLVEYYQQREAVRKANPNGRKK